MMPPDKRPKFTFAPPNYRTEWQSAPRWSGLPFGYFDAARLSRRFWIRVCLALLLVFALFASGAEVSDEEIRVTPAQVRR